MVTKSSFCRISAIFCVTYLNVLIVSLISLRYQAQSLERCVGLLQSGTTYIMIVLVTSESVLLYDVTLNNQ